MQFLLGFLVGNVLGKGALSWESKLSNWTSRFNELADMKGTDAYSATFFKLNDNSQTLVKFQNGSCYDLNGNIKSSQTDQTLYRWASVSKMYATTALFQLIEDGVLSTSDLVVDHLPWLANQLKNHPLTVHDLLHHTVGLDENMFGSFWPFPAKNVSSKSVVEELWTDFTAPNGIAGGPSYSNIGMTILGSIIEEKTNLNLGDYLQKHVYAPLNITHNGFPYEIVQRGKMDDLCYCAESNQYEPYDIPAYSSGGMISTTDDVAKFFIALLQNGQSLFKKPTTSEEFRKAPWYVKYFGPNGYRNGWEFETYKGVEMFTKGGNLMGFHSKAWIIPEFNEGGVFVSTSTDDYRLRDSAVQAFMDLLHPNLSSDTRLPHLPISHHWNVSSSKIEGSYSNLRNVYKGLSRIFSLPASSSLTFKVNNTLGSLDLLQHGQIVNYFPIQVDSHQPNNMVVYQALYAGKVKTLTAVFDGSYSDDATSISYIGIDGTSTFVPILFLDKPWVCYLMLTLEFMSILVSALLGIYSIKYFQAKFVRSRYMAVAGDDALAELEDNAELNPEFISYASLLWTGINIFQLFNAAFGVFILFVGSIIIGMYTINPFRSNPIVLLTLFVSVNLLYSFGAILLVCCIIAYFALKDSTEKVCPIQITLWLCFVAFHILGLIQTIHLNWLSFHFW